MGGEKQGSKSGRYVGGLLQLFEWNAKSRKKLFSSKPDSPEQSDQGKKSERKFPMTRIRLVDGEEFGTGLSINGGSDYSCASSITDDDLYGTKAPGVVARLMGLDSLPTSIPLDPYLSPFFDTLSLQDAPLRRRNIDCSHDLQIMHSKHLLNKVESTPRHMLDVKSQKMPNRPIERFQTEILPPKSARMIPISQNKLLSPIKSPIFVASQDAARIMEAAAKIIEPGPQSTPRPRLSSSSGSSSVPFKVRELKEKLEGAQKPLKAAELHQRPVEEPAAPKYLKGQPMNKSWNGSSLDMKSFKVSPSRDDDGPSVGLIKSKGKSISLAIQAKVNVQKREGLAQSSPSIGGGSEEQDEFKSSQLNKTRSISPKITNKKSSAQSTSSVLRQNNQKQNCLSTNKHNSKSLVSLSTGKKKVVSQDSSSGLQNNLIKDNGPSRNGLRKSSLHARYGDKGAPYSGSRNLPRKKRSIDNLQSSKHEKQSNSNSNSNNNSTRKVSDRQFSWVEESRSKGMDVVSFTFTAPITRSLSGSELSKQMAVKSSNLCEDDSGKKWLNSDALTISSPRLNAIGCDSLSVLLEQKLKELTSNLETSHRVIKTEDSAQQTVVPDSTDNAEENAREKKAQKLFSNFQEVEAMGKYGSTGGETKLWNDCHLPSPVSILEPSILEESCYSSESLASCCTEESQQCPSSIQTPDVSELNSLQTHQTETPTIDTLDSASSALSLLDTAKDSMKPAAWELGYVKDILINVELMFKDYATGRTRDIVNPHLFDQMERKQGIRKLEFRLERKVLFDCVSECLDLRCQRFIGGGFETWMKGIATVKRQERLAEEVYKEIQGWRSLGSCMVDELVEKDMSSKYGRWLDFEVDEFMVGVEIEEQILDSLVEEMLADAFAL